MPASDCQTPPPGPVPVCCGECDRPYATGHDVFCKRFVQPFQWLALTTTGDRIITGFDGTYAGAGTSVFTGERGHGA